MRLEISLRSKSPLERLSILADLLFCRVTEVLLTSDDKLDVTLEKDPRVLHQVSLPKILATVPVRTLGDGEFHTLVGAVDTELLLRPGFVRAIVFGSAKTQEKSRLPGKTFCGIPLFLDTSLPQKSSVAFLLSDFPFGGLGSVNRLLVGDLT